MRLKIRQKVRIEKQGCKSVYLLPDQVSKMCSDISYYNQMSSSDDKSGIGFFRFVGSVWAVRKCCDYVADYVKVEAVNKRNHPGNKTLVAISRVRLGTSCVFAGIGYGLVIPGFLFVFAKALSEQDQKTSRMYLRIGAN